LTCSLNSSLASSLNNSLASIPASPLTVRVCMPGDWRALKAVRLAALLDAPTAFGVTHASAAAYTDADWQQRAQSAAQRAYVLAFDGDMAVGLAAHAQASDGACHLLAMWVAPAWRGSDAASRLVALAKQRAMHAGHARMVLDVAPENARAAAFYQRQGFVFTSHREPLESHPHIVLQQMACQLQA